MDHHYAIWASDSNILLAQIIFFGDWKEWHDVAQDFLCRTTLTWRHIIGMRDKTQ
jgi:hypothetical protein